ncbi:MAG: Ig-like domain-containing protein [Maribacter sp.]
MFFFVLFLIFSCDKDSDLLVDYVLSEDILSENLDIQIVNDYFTTTSETSIVLDVLSNDSYPELENVRIIETSSPTLGVVKINDDNLTITYTPTTASTTEETTDTFTYTTEVVNQDETTSTEIGNVEVTIISSNEGSQTAKLLFSSGFEGVQLSNTKYDYQYITGTDANTGFSWPPAIWGSNTGGEPNGIHRIDDDGGPGIDNSLETVIGHNGSSTTALFSRVNYRIGATQSPYQINNIQNDPAEFYITYWMKIDATSLASKNDWRAIWEYKSDDFDYQSPNPGFRVIAFIGKDNGGNLYWKFEGGDDPSSPTWEIEVPDSTLPVPRNEWFKVEYYIKLSHLDDGRAWMKINNVLIGDHTGPNLGSATDTMSFMMLTQVYGNSHPMHQWVDDIEIWDGVPN